jgi:CheY-like chemotaxis protein
VLLIEDEDALREAVGAFLEAQGYTTVAAEDAQRAVEILEKPDLPRPCLVLADLITLRVDWASLMNALQQDDQLASLPMALVFVRQAGQASKRVKRPVDFDLLGRIVEKHCCGGDRQGGKPVGGRSSLGSDPAQ